MKNNGFLFFLKRLGVFFFLFFFSIFLFGSSLVSAVSVYDNNLWVERSINLSRTSCTTQSYKPETLFTEVLLPQSKIAYTTELQSAISAGTWAISKHYYQSDPSVYRIIWSDSLTTNWLLNTTYLYFASASVSSVTVSLGSNCLPILSALSGGSNVAVSSSATLSPSADRVSLSYFGDGVVVGAYPSGYTGLSLVPYTLPSTAGSSVATDSFNETVEATVSIILDEADTAVKLGLLLGAVHFLYQWLMSVLMSRRIEQK